MIDKSMKDKIIQIAKNNADRMKEDILKEFEPMIIDIVKNEIRKQLAKTTPKDEAPKKMEAKTVDIKGVELRDTKKK